MKVSILIPCYNAEKWIKEAIVSALSQTYPAKEIIVYDDGSTDGSLEVVKSFGDQITWRSGPNCGGNVARNHLLDMATGEWLQYLDADDYLEPNHVARKIECAALHSDAGIIYTPTVYEYWNENGATHREIQDLQKYEQAGNAQAKDEAENHDPYVLMAHWMLPQTGAILWKREAMLKVGGWKSDQPCCQENELFLRLLKDGQKFVFCSDAGAVYRQWSQETVCRRNPLQTFTVRQDIVTDMESYLAQKGMLTYERKDAIAHSRIQCARSMYQLDRNVAQRLVQQALKSHSQFRLPVAPYFPRAYRVVFTLLGFKQAETVADFMRRFRQPA